MVRRDAAEFPDLPAEIAAAARKAAAPHHICSCGKRFDRPAWNQLPRVGVQYDGEVHLELRNCDRCGSTRAVEITALEADLIRGNDSLVGRCTALADRVGADCAQAIQRTRATADMLERALFVALQEPPRNESGASRWHPSHSLVCLRGGK